MSKLAIYRSYLQSRGIAPKVTDDFVLFSFEGGHYALAADDRDPAFFQLIFPNFHAIVSPEARAIALAAASQTNAQIKVAKVFLSWHAAVPEKNVQAGEDMTATVEMLVPNPDQLGEVFDRSLLILRDARNAFEARVLMLGMMATLPEEVRRKLEQGGSASAA